MRTTKKIIALLFLGVAVCLFGSSNVSAQADESSEPTTVSSVTDATLPWGAQRVLPAKVPAEFDSAFDKVVAEGGGKIAGGTREFLAWEGNYKLRSKAEGIKAEGIKAEGIKAEGIKAEGIKAELLTDFRKEGWQYESAAREGEVEFFSLTKEGLSPRAVVGFFVSGDGVFVCGLMEIQKADSGRPQTESRPVIGSGDGGIAGKWFRTTGGSTIDWTGKTTLKGGEDFTFVFSQDGSVEYMRKKEILNVMQCRINSLDNARGHYTLNGSTLRMDLGAMRSTGSNSCNSKENYNKTLGDSTMTVQIQIKRMDDIVRPDKPYVMCFDGNEVCYEKQR